jgi:myosin-9
LRRKNKSFRPRQQGKKGLKNLESMKTLAGRTQSHHKARKQPLTVTAQFQQSLHSLMDTLNQANPFFIRCIKSNAEKVSYRDCVSSITSWNDRKGRLTLERVHS